MREKFSVPTLLILGAVLILGSVSLITKQSPVTVSVSKPYSKADSNNSASFYDLNNDRKIDNKDVRIVTSNMGYNSTPKNPADLNRDGKVDVQDLQLIRDYLWTNNLKSYFDLNGDGVVNNKDVQMVVAKFGTVDFYTDIQREWPLITGQVSKDDVSFIRKYILDIFKDPESFFDLNGDGKVNNRDVQMVVDKVGTIDWYTRLTANSVSEPGSSMNAVSQDDVKMIATYIFDLNGDGKVNKADQDIMTNVILGTAKCPAKKNCDFNGDGRVNVADAVTLTNMILKASQGQICIFGICFLNK